jgi:hypothetical protein
MALWMLGYQRAYTHRERYRLYAYPIIYIWRKGIFPEKYVPLDSQPNKNKNIELYQTCTLVLYTRTVSIYTCVYILF